MRKYFDECNKTIKHVQNVISFQNYEVKNVIQVNCVTSMVIIVKTLQLLLCYLILF